MADLTPEQVEEIRFRTRLERSRLAALAVAAYLERQGWSVDVPPVVVRPHFKDRKAYSDSGDIHVWKAQQPREVVEVKWRSIDFTCAEDFPYPLVNVDRVAKRRLAFMYVSTNYALTHALIIHASSKPRWRVEKSTDKKRGYEPFDVYRCSREDIEFVSLLPPKEETAVKNPFFGLCRKCLNPGMYWAAGRWSCEQHREGVTQWETLP